MLFWSYWREEFAVIKKSSEFPVIEARFWYYWNSDYVAFEPFSICYIFNRARRQLQLTLGCPRLSSPEDILVHDVADQTPHVYNHTWLPTTGYITPAICLHVRHVYCLDCRVFLPHGVDGHHCRYVSVHLKCRTRGFIVSISGALWNWKLS